VVTVVSAALMIRTPAASRTRAAAVQRVGQRRRPHLRTKEENNNHAHDEGRQIYELHKEQQADSNDDDYIMIIMIVSDACVIRATMCSHSCRSCVEELLIFSALSLCL
jgi:hypothetical protein